MVVFTDNLVKGVVKNQRLHRGFSDPTLGSFGGKKKGAESRGRKNEPKCLRIQNEK